MFLGGNWLYVSFILGTEGRDIGEREGDVSRGGLLVRTGLRCPSIGLSISKRW